ncbi:MAG: hypothetical protein HQK49_07330 [Oligoflexia bacterium]|nr:hypothetical protein [Oligoflexia bacterium]
MSIKMKIIVSFLAFLFIQITTINFISTNLVYGSEEKFNDKKIIFNPKEPLGFMKYAKRIDSKWSWPTDMWKSLVVMESEFAKKVIEDSKPKFDIKILKSMTLSFYSEGSDSEFNKKRYFNDQKRKQNKLMINDDFTCTRKGNTKPLSGIYNFVMDAWGRIYLHETEDSSKQHIHHSFLSSGLAIAGAGEIHINKNGKITEVNNFSGHYKPGTRELLNVYSEIKGRYKNNTKELNGINFKGFKNNVSNLKDLMNNDNSNTDKTKVTDSKHIKIPTNNDDNTLNLDLLENGLKKIDDEDAFIEDND